MIRRWTALLGTGLLILLAGCGSGSTTNNGRPVMVRGPQGYQIDLSQVDVVPFEKIPANTVGIMFCIDVSPSMNDSVGGHRKIDIAKQTTKQVLSQIEQFAQKNPNKKVLVGLTAFSGRADVVQPMLPFDQPRLSQLVDSLRSGNGTAIGAAMVVGTQELLKTGVESRAIIVLTDGENNIEPSPEQAVAAILGNKNNKEAPTDDIKVFLIAFDINAHVFEATRSAGATVMEARDRASLEGIMTKTVEEVLLEKPQ